VGHRVVHGGASLIHVDEMKKKITFSSWHRSTIQRTWKEFTSLQLFYIGKTNGFYTLPSNNSCNRPIRNKFLTENNISGFMEQVINTFQERENT
jgi:hypothetical protein